MTRKRIHFQSVDDPALIEIHGLGDEKGFMAKGHYNADDFHHAVRAYRDVWIPPQGVVHTWWRCVPSSDPSERGYMYYHPAKAGSRRAFAVTFTYHEDPSCIFCAACKGKGERRIHESEHLRNRKMLKDLWIQAAAGDLVRLEIQESEDGSFQYLRYPYRDVDEQRRREALAA